MTTLKDIVPDADPRIFQFFDAWNAARAVGGVHRTIPYKRDFDPASIPGLLHQTWLYRYDPDLGDFVCNLAGEEVNHAWGKSIRGMRLRDIVGIEDHPTILDRWHRIVGKGMVHYGASRERLTRLKVQIGERLLLPLLDGEDRVDYVLGISLYRFGSNDPGQSTLQEEDIIQFPCAELDCP
ncbi:PAS domain-containing protein [Rhodospirillaceae bacterium KN72]|uniref:PAS domain-containing protein n=1 Tax=Pacificispira spongiicola TaxID=2729598 RepID=A0A7Y0DZW1_9PROT|nr:PAS domain-containing protein [Pacificispira spongiicola]NMM44553.1 PAS domain-containing protein [Pacificispira spongiicola]